MSSEYALRVLDAHKGFNLPRSPLDRVLQGFSFGVLGRTRRHEVLRGVRFDVRRGETLALLGVNGAGKSTLLQMIAGTMAPSAGRIEVTGKVAALLELGAGFSPDFTGRENAILNARLLGVAEDEARALLPWIIAFSGIGDSVDRPVRYYSSGMFVRLAFAVAAAVRPDVMIIDEALGVGDAAFQAKCYQYLKHELGHVTKIIVSHDTALVGALAERVIVLGEGRVIHDGAVSEGLGVYHKAIQPRDAAAETSAGAAGGLEIEAVTVAGVRRAHAWGGDAMVLDLRAVNRGAAPQHAVATVVIEDAYGQGVAANDGRAADAPRFVLPPGESRHRVRFPWPSLRAGQYVVRAGLEPDPFGPDPDDGILPLTATANLEGMSRGSGRGILSLDVDGGDPLAALAHAAE